MTYQERISALKRMALCNPDITDRELSIMIDAEFGKEDEEKEKED